MRPHSPCKLALVDMEPALAHSLVQLFREYPEFDVTLGEPNPEDPPDVLLVSPRQSERLQRLRQAFPSAAIVARVPWDRPAYWQNPHLDERLDELAPFPVVLSTLRKVFRQLRPSA